MTVTTAEPPAALSSKKYLHVSDRYRKYITYVFLRLPHNGGGERKSLWVDLPLLSFLQVYPGTAPLLSENEH